MVTWAQQVLLIFIFVILVSFPSTCSADDNNAPLPYGDLFTKEEGHFFGPDFIVAYNSIDADECARRCLQGYGSYDSVNPPCLSFNHRPAGSPEGDSARCWLHSSNADTAVLSSEWDNWPHRNYYQRKAHLSYEELFTKEEGHFFGDNPDFIVAYNDIDAEECARRCLKGYGSYDGVNPPCLSFNHRPAGSPEGGSARCWLRSSNKDKAASPGSEWNKWPHRNYYQKKGYAHHHASSLQGAIDRLNEVHAANPRGGHLEQLCFFAKCTYEQVTHLLPNLHEVNSYWSDLACYKYSRSCRVDGQWSEWGPWSDCSVGCGRGSNVRRRNCSDPAPRNGGWRCAGKPVEIKECTQNKKCSSGNCRNIILEGTPIKEAHRSSLTAYTAGDETWLGYPVFKATENGPCGVSTCSVYVLWMDHGIGQWCFGKGTVGERSCFFEVATRGYEPQPTQVSYIDEEVEEYTYMSSPDLHIICNEDAKEWMNIWSPWGQCQGDPYCSIGTRQRQMTCPSGIEGCPRRTEAGNGVVATSEEFCTLPPCHVDGGWSAWSEWSVSTSNCGEGKRGRFRTCNQPIPQAHGKDCPGPRLLVQAVTMPCRRGRFIVGDLIAELTDDQSRTTSEEMVVFPSFLEIAGEQSPDLADLSDWGQWTSCTRTCWEGSRKRERRCLSNKRTCSGDVRDIQFCNVQPCPVDGGYSEWSPWSACSLTCGDGTQSRNRVCTNPAPSHGGQVCTGPDREEKACEMTRCPDNDVEQPWQWQSWEIWQPCDRTCDMGYRQRRRGCMVNPNVQQANIDDNLNCVGRRMEIMECHVAECAVNGNWAAWSSWSDCTATCGDGVRTRDRTCTDPAPYGDGTECAGQGTEVEHCSIPPCIETDGSTRIFNKNSYLRYPSPTHPSHVWRAFVRFFPYTGDGLLLWTENDVDNENVTKIELGLKEGLIVLKAILGKEEVDVFWEKPKLEAWNDLVATIAGKRVSLRVNDGDIREQLFDVQPPPISFGGPLFLGGAISYTKDSFFKSGFQGKVSDLWINYQQFSLNLRFKTLSGDWIPVEGYKSINKTTDPLAASRIFFGREYAVIPITPPRHAQGSFTISMVLMPSKEEGLLFYNKGKEDGTFIILFLKDNRFDIKLGFGSGSRSRTLGEVVTPDRWMHLQLTIINGGNLEMRINSGPANKMFADEMQYQPGPSLLIGGVTDALWKDLALSRHSKEYRLVQEQRGFMGVIYSVKVYGQEFKMTDVALQRRGLLIDSATTSKAAPVPLSYEDLFTKEEGHFFGQRSDFIVAYNDIDAEECARRCLKGYGSYDGVNPPCLSFNHRPALFGRSREGNSARCWLRSSNKDMAASPGSEWDKWPHRNYYQKKGRRYKEMVTSKGSSLKLRCDYSFITRGKNHSNPHVIWMKEDRRQLEGTFVNITNGEPNNKHVSMLHLRDLHSSMTGSYSCLVEYGGRNHVTGGFGSRYHPAGTTGHLYLLCCQDPSLPGKVSSSWR
ncbi:uncharacterized protein LOC144881901 isoform X2 [Branchiostoma floridae x Branchiostoma japonicum]